MRMTRHVEFNTINNMKRQLDRINRTRLNAMMAKKLGITQRNNKKTLATKFEQNRRRRNLNSEKKTNFSKIPIDILAKYIRPTNIPALRSVSKNYYKNKVLRQTQNQAGVAAQQIQRFARGRGAWVKSIPINPGNSIFYRHAGLRDLTTIRIPARRMLGHVQQKQRNNGEEINQFFVTYAHPRGRYR